MAIHAPITGAPLRAPLQPTFRIANRAEIENEIERLIGLLDAADAPSADLEAEEDFAADDIACDVSRESYLPILPRYGEDQARGPTNVRAAEKLHHRMMMDGRL